MGVLEQLTRTAVFFKELWTKPLARQLVIGGATFVLIAMILLSNFLVAKVDLKVGQVAPREIVAPALLWTNPRQSSWSRKLQGVLCGKRKKMRITM